MAAQIDYSHEMDGMCFLTVLDSIEYASLEHNKHTLRNRTIRLMMKLFRTWDIQRIIATMKGIEPKHMDDEKALKHISSLAVKNNKHVKKHFPWAEEHNEITLDHIIKAYDIPKKFEKLREGSPAFEKIRYLDISCGDGKKTLATANILGVEKGGVYGVDIEKWLGYSGMDADDAAKFGITLAPYLEGNRLPFGDDQFNVMSCYMSLHHMTLQERETVVREAARCLLNGGVFILREHDAASREDRALAHIEHFIYGIIHEKKPYADFMADYYGDYHSAEEWDFMFSQHGFKKVAGGCEKTPTKAVVHIFRLAKPKEGEE